MRQHIEGRGVGWIGGGIWSHLIVPCGVSSRVMIPLPWNTPSFHWPSYLQQGSQAKT